MTAAAVACIACGAELRPTATFRNGRGSAAAGENTRGVRAS
jgi:hypothetical protein